MGSRESGDTKVMISALQAAYLPHKVVVFRPANGETASEIIRLVPYTQSMKPVNGRATAYVCKQFICRLPTNSVAEMMTSLKTLR